MTWDTDQCGAVDPRELRELIGSITSSLEIAPIDGDEIDAVYREMQSVLGRHAEVGLTHTTHTVGSCFTVLRSEID